MSFPIPEIWKDIKGYEGYYQVSNLGRVKSLKRIVQHSNGSYHTIRERILKNVYDQDGYLRVTLAINGKRPIQQVHRIVMNNFIGNSALQVNHIDGDKENNKLNNLEYVTNIKNINHRELSINNKKKYGVYYLKSIKKHRVIISINNKRTSLGCFESQDEAYRVFYNAYLNLHEVAPW
jgi:hypothetical protein